MFQHLFSMEHPVRYPVHYPLCYPVRYPVRYPVCYPKTGTDPNRNRPGTGTEAGKIPNRDTPSRHRFCLCYIISKNAPRITQKYIFLACFHCRGWPCAPFITLGGCGADHFHWCRQWSVVMPGVAARCAATTSPSAATTSPSASPQPPCRPHKRGVTCTRCMFQHLFSMEHPVRYPICYPVRYPVYYPKTIPVSTRFQPGFNPVCYPKTGTEPEPNRNRTGTEPNRNRNRNRQNPEP